MKRHVGAVSALLVRRSLTQAGRHIEDVERLLREMQDILKRAS